MIKIYTRFKAIFRDRFKSKWRPEEQNKKLLIKLNLNFITLC